MKKLIVALAMTFLMLMAIDISNVLAEPKPKEGNPGLPGCLAQVEQLQQTIADQQATIAEQGATIVTLQEQIATLNGSLKYALPKTGLMTSYSTGDDGDLKKGIDWPEPRFTDHDDGTVTDNLTGLIWLKDARCTSFFPGDDAGLNYRNWSMALTAANSLASGDCGLSDGSVAGDWRLPNVRELESLLDYGRDNPSFPEIHPFTGLVAGRYWSSTATNISAALLVNFYFGYVDHEYKDIEFYVWPVRDAK